MAKVHPAQLFFLAVFKTPSLPLSHSHTYTDTLRHQRTSHIVFDFAISCRQLWEGGREGGERGVTGSLTSRALQTIIGVQEVVEAAGYNWTAARNLCGWLSKPRSPFHRPSQLLPWYKAPHRQATDTATSISLQNVGGGVCLCSVCVNVWVGGSSGEVFNEAQSSPRPWSVHPGDD